MNDERRPLSPASGLASLPGPPPRKPPLRTPPTTGSSADPAPGSSADAEAAEPTLRIVATPTSGERGPGRSAAKRPQGDTAQRPISFTTPLDVRAKLREAAANGTTVADVVLAAVERAEPQLTALVEDERPAALPGSGLFPDRASSPRRNREPRVLVSLRLSAANVEVLDELTIRHEADDRSQLLTAALRAHLQSPDINVTTARTDRLEG